MTKLWFKGLVSESSVWKWLHFADRETGFEKGDLCSDYGNLCMMGLGPSVYS